MANYSTLKAAVADVVKTNGSQAITGANLQTVLLSIINSIGGGGYIFNGVATPSTDAGTPDQNVFYIGGAGTYANFGTSVVVPPTNIAVFKYNGTWNCEQLTVENGGVFDISAYNNNTTYADLAAALGTNGANVPESVRKGGMSVKFVCSSDNKYVQYRLMSDEWSTTVANWEQYNNVSVSQNTETDGYKVRIGEDEYEFASEKNIQDIISTDEWKIIDSSTKEDMIIDPSSHIKANSNYKLIYYPVSNGQRISYRTNSTTTIYLGFTNEIPVLNSVVTNYDYWANGQGNVPREVQSNINGYFCLSVKKEFTAEIVAPNDSLAKKISVLEPKVAKNEEDISNLKESVSTLDEKVEGLYTKEYEVNTGETIYDIYTRIYADIAEGKTIKCKIVDISNTLSPDAVGAFAYWVGDTKIGYLEPEGLAPNQEYTFIAPQNITAISWSRHGQYIVGSGEVTFKLIIPSEFDRIRSEIEVVDDKVEAITNPDEYKPTVGSVVSGLIIDPSNQLLANTNWKVIYIPVSNGETLQYNTSSTERFYVGFTIELPALNVAITGYDYWNSGVLRTITSQVDGYFCVSVKNEYDVQFYVENDSMELRLEAVEEEVFKPQNDYDVDCASDLFGIYNGLNGKEYFTALYPEGLSKTILPIKFNGKKKVLIQTLCGSSLVTDGETTENKSVVISGDGYKSKTIPFTYHKVNPKNAQNKNIHILTIGDSIRALITGLTSDDTDVASWAGWMKRMSIENNAIFGNINLNFIGTTNKEQGSYQGQSYVVYGEGRGGWSTYGYINWPIEQRFYDPTNPTTRFNAEEGYYALGLATKTPYCSSVAGRAWTDFDNGDTTQKDVICTPFGRFKPDYCAALWIGCKKYSAFTGTGDWVDTPENRAKIDALFTLWVDNAQSPFFDIDHARAHTGTDDAPIWTNPSGFSIAKYLERYRTCDDLGVTLVGSAGETVTGSDGNQYTIGTKVTDTSAWNVCTPTHIIEMLGTNDANSSADNRIEVQKLLLAELTAYEVKSAYFIPRRVGVFYPADWQEEGMTRTISAFWLSVNYPYAKGIRQYIGDLSASKIVNYIPVYNTMSPFGSAYVTKKCVDMDYADNVKLLTGTDDLHPNGVQLRSIALQALGWLYWSEM